MMMCESWPCIAVMTLYQVDAMFIATWCQSNYAERYLTLKNAVNLGSPQNVKRHHSTWPRLKRVPRANAHRLTLDNNGKKVSLQTTSAALRQHLAGDIRAGSRVCTIRLRCCSFVETCTSLRARRALRLGRLASSLVDGDIRLRALDD